MLCLIIMLDLHALLRQYFNQDYNIMITLF